MDLNVTMLTLSFVFVSTSIPFRLKNFSRCHKYGKIPKSAKKSSVTLITMKVSHLTCMFALFYPSLN